MNATLMDKIRPVIKRSFIIIFSSNLAINLKLFLVQL